MEGGQWSTPDPKRFASEGYCLFPDVLNADETVAVRSMLDEALEEQLPLPSRWHREYDESTAGIDRANIIGEPTRGRFRGSSCAGTHAFSMRLNRCSDPTRSSCTPVWS